MTTSVYNDHQFIAGQARSAPGEWVSAGLYQTEEGADSTARKVRSGRSPAYTPAGHFEAAVNKADGFELQVRYVGERPDRKATVPPEQDRRPIGVVAEARAEGSKNPGAFRMAMSRTLSAWRRGENPAHARWGRDPIERAAEVEALAGLRRLALADRFRKEIDQ